ncbi:unnamed protein product [Rotaria sp. Silwood1]|nr:unnamed protein product [Rotaria sp. Silwood1]CAF4659216.1 unnamed protein product [Rotaria sp. Silwood1]
MEYIAFDAIFDALSGSGVKNMARTVLDTLLRMDNGLHVIQLETACGAAIQSFEGAQDFLIFIINKILTILFLIKTSILDCRELDSLIVSGDVTFGKGVSLRNTVIIIANHSDRIDISAGAILENKIVFGNLRILEY